MIEETLAPGIYLLGENAFEHAVTVLHNAGIEIVANLSNLNRTHDKENMFFDSGSSAFSNPFPSLSSLLFQEFFPKVCTSVSNTENTTQNEKADVLTEKFHAILANLSLNAQDRLELSARINRRLVLCETQLKNAYLRFEKLEARLMDYAGKQNVAKQAISQRSPVEIIWPGAEKSGFTEGEKIFGIPKALDKSNGELTLVVEQILDGSSRSVYIPLAKISLLRRIKKSIFER
jgi:hypothetical protein